MSLGLDLTSDERKQLEALLGADAQESAPQVSLNELLGQWTGFVRAVERGYDDSIYEYTNDLSVRDRIQKLIDASPSTLRSKLESELEPTDHRFAVATEAAARPLTTTPGDLPSWWCRVPKRRVGELAEDLEAMGHVE